MKPASPVVRGYESAEMVIAEAQPPYDPLPAIICGEPKQVITRWHMTWRERLTALWTGDVYLQVLTFGRPLQPLAMGTIPPLEPAASSPRSHEPQEES